MVGLLPPLFCKVQGYTVLHLSRLKYSNNRAATNYKKFTALLIVRAVYHQLVICVLSLPLHHTYRRHCKSCFVELFFHLFIIMQLTKIGRNSTKEKSVQDTVQNSKTTTKTQHYTSNTNIIT